MEEELAIVVAAVSAYLGLPPGRIDLSETLELSTVPVIRLHTPKRVWKWSLTTAHRTNFRQIKVDAKQRLSTWRQATP